jgi:hypothetical protein
MTAALGGQLLSSSPDRMLPRLQAGCCRARWSSEGGKRKAQTHWVEERERDREREVLLTIKKSMKVGK